MPKVIDPGHVYELGELDGQTPARILCFVKRQGEGYPGNESHHAGTTTQEVLRALIDRTKYVHAQIPHDSNEQVLHHLRSAFYWLEVRAAYRHGRELPRFDMDEIELQPVCVKCGHIGCQGACHG